jgi:hypothetical protein
MIGHQNKRVEKVTLLVTVMEQDFDKQPCHRFLTKKRSSLKSGSGDEIDAISSVSSEGCCHKDLGG